MGEKRRVNVRNREFSAGIPVGSFDNGLRGGELEIGEEIEDREEEY